MHCAAAGPRPRQPDVTVLGLTFKEDVPDTRNSKVADIITELRSFGIEVQVNDPLADPGEALHEYGVTLTLLDKLSPPTPWCSRCRTPPTSKAAGL